MAKVKHIVLFSFKAEATEEQRNKCFDELLNLSESVPGIEDYVCGPNNSPEGLNQGYDHGFVMTFTDAATRDAYLTHPDHDRAKTEVLPHVEKFVVLDFEV